MNNLKAMQEKELFKKYIHNRGENFSDSLLEKCPYEPCDLRYNGINYQITTGDRIETENRKNIISKGGIYTIIRNLSINITETLLGSILRSKSIKSDSSTILLIELEGGDYRISFLERDLKSFIDRNKNTLDKWKEIYAVFPEKNIRIE